MSVVPVTLPPGASFEATSLAATGSVTAPNRIGVSVIALAAAWAVGVAIAKTRSRPASLNVLAMAVALACSPWAFCSSNSTVRPASAMACLKPSRVASRAGCETIWVMPTL